MKKKAIWTILIIFLVAVIPVIINECYKVETGYITMWGASNVLSYYGTILASSGAIIGVYFSIKAAHKNYEEDSRNRVLPFIAVTPFEHKSTINPLTATEKQIEKKEQDADKELELPIYEEYKLNQIYFVITPNGITPQRSLNKDQEDVLFQAGAVWKPFAKGVMGLQRFGYFSIPLEIENVGNGTAVNCRIGFNREIDNDHRYIRPMMIKQNQTFYIHIFSMETVTETLKEVYGEYILEFYYEDIYGNKYVQKFPVSFGENEKGRIFQSISLVGKQEACIG